MLEIIHISDTHFGPDQSLDIRGANSWKRARALVQAINELPFTPDFIVHTGDIVNDPDEQAYALAEDILSQLKAPLYYATGNHDDVPMMRKSLTFAELDLLVPEADEQMCYRIACPAGKNVEFFVIDGKVPPDDGPHGFVSQSQIEAISEQISGEKPVAVFIHYPLLPVGSRWIDEHLLVTNRSEVVAMLKEKAGDQLRGVFSGHLHRGLTLYRDGILNSAVSSPACEFTASPDDEFCDFIPGGPIPFNHITFTAEGTWVKSYSLPFHDE